MAAKLPPGGRFVNYDPQTYSSYPGSPQGVPDLNIIPGLPSVSGYASIVNGNYEIDDPHPRAGRSRHRPTLVGDARPARPARGRDRARVLPRAAAGDADARSTISRRSPRTSARTPCSPAAIGGELQRHRLPVRPGPAPRPRGGPDGLLVLRRAARARQRHPRPAAPGRPGNGCALRGVARPTGRPAGAPRSRSPPARSTVTGRHPAGAAIGLSVQVLTGSLPPQRAVISVAGHPYELAGSLSSALVPGPWQLAGFSQGYAVFTLRKPAEPIVASTAQRPAAARAGRLQHDQVRGDPAHGALRRPR